MMYWTHIATDHHTAHKQHVCIWCGESIVPGERYVKTCGVVETEFQVSKYHTECYDAMIDDADLDEDYDGFEPHSYFRGKTELR